MSELKPCPFCGCEAVYETFRQEHWLGTKEPLVFCNGCKAEFSIEDESPFLNIDEDYKWRKKRTAEAWNRRAQDNDAVNLYKEAYINEHDERIEEIKINKMSTADVVEVVRCKDCVYWERDVIFPDGFCRPRLQGNPNWYCADGKRREEEHDAAEH